ncbi:MAG: ester cyclase [Actinobacteria bacterium]|nr:ester cyclase [Actinomycetota bacterium]
MSDSATSAPTLEERNKATVRRLQGALAGGEESVGAAIDELVSPDVKIRSPLPLDSTGASALKEVFGRLHAAFPDLHVEIEDLIAEGDKVVSRNTVTGTHRGAFMGLPPTGRSVSYNEIFVARFAAGRLVETWGVVDMASLMRQLGLLPGPPPAG